MVREGIEPSSSEEPHKIAGAPLLVACFLASHPSNHERQTAPGANQSVVSGVVCNLRAMVFV